MAVDNFPLLRMIFPFKGPFGVVEISQPSAMFEAPSILVYLVIHFPEIRPLSSLAPAGPPLQIRPFGDDSPNPNHESYIPAMSPEASPAPSVYIWPLHSCSRPPTKCRQRALRRRPGPKRTLRSCRAVASCPEWRRKCLRQWVLLGKKGGWNHSFYYPCRAFLYAFPQN